jgi:hypothetical protein
MRKLLLSTAILAALGYTSKAQIAIAPEVGLNMSNMKFGSTPGVTRSDASIMGFKAGVIVDLGITGKLSIQPGIFYSIKGSNQKWSAGPLSINQDIIINYVEVPVNIQYEIVDVKVGKVFVGAGPYLGYAISGKTRGISPTTAESDLSIGSDASDLIKAMDLGVNVNAGFLLGKGLFARLQYGMGLTNTSSAPANSIKNSCFSISVGYFFGRKR